MTDGILDDDERPIEPGPAWLGPKASEDEIPVTRRFGGGLTLRAVVPNAITAAALCSGLTGIRFAIVGDWEKALFAIILAGVLDGMDGRIARLLKAQSRFGAELDSLADSLSFGMAPALVLFLWSLQDLPRFGWFAALAFAISCARDAQLEIGTAAQFAAPGDDRSCRDCLCSTADGTVVDAGGNLPRLSRARPARRDELRQGQAAASRRSRCG